ncbi:MAG: hypothetical protein ACRD1G_14580 [Acidimicrobiales bacterium]
MVIASGATGPPFGCDFDGAGDPVQTEGVVPGAVDGGSFGVHALNSVTETASELNAVAAAILRLAAGLTIGKD